MNTDRFERLVTGDAALTTLSAAWEIELWGRILAFECIRPGGVSGH